MTDLHRRFSKLRGEAAGLGLALVVCTTFAFSSPSVEADVIVETAETYDIFGSTVGDPASGSFSFVDSTDTVFLVAIALDGGGTPPTVISVILDPGGVGGFGETALDPLVESEGFAGHTYIYGVDLGNMSAGSLTYEVDFSANDGAAVSLLQLSSATLAGALTDTDSDGNNAGNTLSSSFNGLPDGSFILNVVSNDQGNDSAYEVGGTPSPTHVELEDGLGAGNNQGFTSALTYTTGVSGDFNRTFGPNLDGDVGDNTETLAAIAILDANLIPEPASFALMGLGGLALVRRRRRCGM